MDRILGYFRGLENLLPPAPQQDGSRKKTTLPAESYSFRDTFSDTEAFISLLENVFSNLDDKEYRICMNHDGSVLIERILLATRVPSEEGEEWRALDTAFYLRVFVDRLSGRYAEMARHRYASHVVQTILRLLAWHKDSKSGDQGELPTVEQLVDTLRKELFDAGIFCDVYGSHVGRDLVDTLHAFSKDCALDGMLDQLAFDNNGSLVLQHYMQLTNKSFNLTDDFIKPALRHPAASRFLEMHMQAALTTSTSFHAFYAQHFRGSLKDLLNDPIANHLVKSLIRMAHGEHQVTLIMQEMDSFDFVGGNRVLILVALVEWANEHQGLLGEQVAKFVFEAFGLRSTMEKKGAYTRILLDTNQRINPGGAQLLTCLAALDCDKYVKYLFDSLLDTPADQLVQWSKDRVASRPLEAFICSKSLSRTRLVKKFIGHFESLATDRVASHTVEKCYHAADLELKTKILSELAVNVSRLREDPYGKYVVRNCGVEEYARKSEEWKKREEGKERKRKALQDLISQDDLITPPSASPAKTRKLSRSATD